MLQGVSGSADPNRRRGSAKAFAGGGDREAVARQLRALASMLRDLGALGSQADEQYLANVDLAPRYELYIGGSWRAPGAFP